MHVQRVAEALVQRGHDVTVLTARYHPSLPRDTVMHNGVRVIRLWAPIHISRGMIMPAYLWAPYLLMRQHDVVSVHTPIMESAILALSSFLSGRDIVITHHGDLILPPTLMNRFIQGLMYVMYRVMAKRAKRLIAYSRDYAENSYYLRPFLDKTSVIYPPIQTPRPRPERVQALRAQWAHEGGPIIGYSGRFVQEKRPDLAIRALEVVNQTYPNARLVFAGEYDIPYEDTWRQQQPLVRQYQDQLRFLGLLTDPQDLADFYAACDVVVLPSDTECFALVQVEAMLCGTPVVMTDIPGGRVPVTVTGMGKLAEAGNWRAIGEAIVDVIAHRADYVRPRDYIEACFSFDETINRYEAIFQTVAGDAHG